MIVGSPLPDWPPSLPGRLDSGFPPARLAPVPAGKASFFGRDAFGGAGGMGPAVKEAPERGMGPAVKEAPERGKWMKIS